MVAYSLKDFSTSMANEELFRYRCQLSMDSDILKDQKTIYYKYVVHSSKEEKEDDFEFLHGAPESKTRVLNRCLKVPMMEFLSGNSVFYSLCCQY